MMRETRGASRPQATYDGASRGQHTRARELARGASSRANIGTRNSSSHCNDAAGGSRIPWRRQASSHLSLTLAAPATIHLRVQAASTAAAAAFLDTRPELTLSQPNGSANDSADQMTDRMTQPTEIAGHVHWAAPSCGQSRGSVCRRDARGLRACAATRRGWCPLTPRCTPQRAASGSGSTAQPSQGAHAGGAGAAAHYKGARAGSSGA